MRMTIRWSRFHKHYSSACVMLTGAWCREKNKCNQRRSKKISQVSSMHSLIIYTSEKEKNAAFHEFFSVCHEYFHDVKKQSIAIKFLPKSKSDGKTFLVSQSAPSSNTNPSLKLITLMRRNEKVLKVNEPQITCEKVVQDFGQRDYLNSIYRNNNFEFTNVCASVSAFVFIRKFVVFKSGENTCNE